MTEAGLMGVDSNRLPIPIMTSTSVSTLHRTALLRLEGGDGTITECFLVPGRSSVVLACSVHSVPVQNRS